MQNALLRKGLVYGIIILFFGASVVPNITRNIKGSNEEKKISNIDDETNRDIIFFDDFNTWDTSKWKTYNDPTVSVSNGELTLTETHGPGGGAGFLVSKTKIPSGTITEIRFKQVQGPYHLDSQYAALNQDTGTSVTGANEIQAWDSNYQNYWRFWTQRDGSGDGWDYLGDCPDIFNYHTIAYEWESDSAKYYFDSILKDTRTVNVPTIDLNVVFRAQEYNSIVIDWVKVTELGSGNQPPIADFTWIPQTPKPNETINFNASLSYDPDGSIVSYAWDFDNDGQFDDKTGNYITWWSWPNNGAYPVSLKVTDDDNISNILTKTIIVEGENQPPVANAGGPYSASIGESITFSGSQSYDPDGNIEGYRWDFTNDGSWDTSWLTSPTREYMFYSEFHGYVGLQVKDDFGVTSSATVKVDINKLNKAPGVDFSGAPGFELLFLLSAIGISILLWKKKRNK
jgi:hypothetical protein